MLDALGFNEPLAVNTIGHCMGVFLFGLVLYLLSKDRQHTADTSRRLPLLIALFAMLWNIGSLGALASVHYSWLGAELLITTSFSILSLLPAFLLHFSLGDTDPAIWKIGYAISLVALVMHIIAPSSNSVALNQFALWVITLGFGGLTVLAVFALALRASSIGIPKGSRLLAAMSLFLFAISFTHFSAGHEQLAWSQEIAIHHAGIPLALFILLQDYRFLMLDAFLRVLVNIVAAAVFTGIALFLDSQLHFTVRATSDPFLQAILIVAVFFLFASFVPVRLLLQHWLTRIVFRRPNLSVALHQIQRLGSTMSNEQVFLDQTAELVCEYMDANAVLIRKKSGYTPFTKSAVLENPSKFADSDSRSTIEVAVPLRFSQGDSIELFLGRRRGGRRYLSEDLEDLDTLASATTEQIERYRHSEIQRMFSQAELRSLQAQMNPHFLFNSLNTLYGTIPRTAVESRRMVLDLADIFRYFLQPEKPFLPLSEELRIIEAYLNVESLRLGNRLRKEVRVAPDAMHISIPALSIQPLVENAVKHGIAANPNGGTVSVSAEIIENHLRVRVEDTGSNRHGVRPPKEGAGLALDNVRRRLELCYGPESKLSVSLSPGGSTVEFLIPASVSGNIRYQEVDPSIPINRPIT